MINYTDYIKLIEEKLKEKKYEEVIKLANSALENDIDKAFLYYKYIGQAEFCLANYDAALENYKISLELNDLQYDIYFNIGVIYLYFEEFNNVISNFHKVIRNNPLYKSFYKEKNFNYEFPNSEICADEYKELLKMYSNQPLVLANLSLITDDENYINQALEIEPDNYVWYTIKFYMSYPHYSWYNDLPNIKKSLELNPNQPILEIFRLRHYKGYIDDIYGYTQEAQDELNKLKIMINDFEKKYPNYPHGQEELQWIKKYIKQNG